MKRIIAGLICIVATFTVVLPAVQGQSRENRIHRIIEVQRAMDVQRAMAVQALELNELQVRLSTIRTRPGWSSFSANPDQLITNQQIQEDLELDQDQLRELKQLQQEYREQVQQGLKDAKQGESFDARRWKVNLQKINDDRKSAYGAILLPHQSKRLKQISTQMNLKQRGDLNTLVGKAMADELGIDEAQKTRLKERSAEIKAELEEEIAKLKEKARQKLLKELRSDQRRKFEDMVGEKFKYKK